MPDIIRLLPDSVANQIAAGEVIQRPASVVKELLENSVDAGATDIRLVITDAGRTLVQVIDNGCGMSETDARLCFERHATSKIKEASDLFNIRTMGFRGEALASIAAIAHTELKTKRKEDELGTCIITEGSEVKGQQPCSCNDGTSISVKNLFYNVPARRNFLKSDNIETTHITEEFIRVAMANPDISFSMYNNNKEVYILKDCSSLRQRIVKIIGDSYTQKLVPVEQETEYVKIYGFIGKPEHARKTRGEQYFFVNKRFIKHPYLNHSVINAFEELIPASLFPSYFIFFEINPEKIDINIHPTKTEIKFEDEKLIYAFLRSSVKMALGKHSLTPVIDFEVEKSFELPSSYKDKPPVPPQIKLNPDYNPFKETEKYTRKEASSLEKSNSKNWQKLYPENIFQKQAEPAQQSINIENEDETTGQHNKTLFQLYDRYILTITKSGLAVIDQQKAHERILYERFIKMYENRKNYSQKLLFPQTIEFSAADAEMITGLIDEFNAIGFDIEAFGKNTFIVNGTPAGIENNNIKELLEGALEEYKKNLTELKADKKANIAQSMAKRISVKSGKKLKHEEMDDIVNELFACKVPETTPSGKPIMNIITIEELEKIFK